jgi:hypothetical protein
LPSIVACSIASDDDVASTADEVLLSPTLMDQFLLLEEFFSFSIPDSCFSSVFPKRTTFCEPEVGIIE